MGSKEKFLSIISQSHGYDDIGFAQTSGAISSIARFGSGRWAKYAMVTASTAHNLTKGQAINITGTTYYDGPTRVVHIVSSTVFAIKRPFYVTATGSWDLKSADGNWEAVQPLGAGVSAANISMTFWDANQQGGNELANDLTQDKVYPIPGGLKRITLATAGNVRLFRGATTKPNALKSPTPPTVIGYLPTGGASGESIDILGREFDPAVGNNSVWFYSGGTAIAAQPTRVDQDGGIITVAVPSAAIAAGIITVKTNGLATATGPTFNVH